jgi:hypothetical protein
MKWVIMEKRRKGRPRRSWHKEVKNIATDILM